MSKAIFSLLSICFLATTAFSQQNDATFKFETKFYDAVDEWVVFPKKASDSTFIYGFIYIDQQAGFTFNLESQLGISEKGLYSFPKDSTIGFMKYRLDSRTTEVAVLSEAQRNDLKLPVEPAWLQVYKENAGKVSYLKDLGYHYNHVGASHLAVEPLEKAYQMDSNHEGLLFELTYAYNALNQPNKAIGLLVDGIEENPQNALLYRELGYAYLLLGNVEDAEKVYKQGISVSKNDSEKSEMAINMAQAYFKKQNRPKFDEWAQLTKTYAEEGSTFLKYIKAFEDNWGKL